MIPRTSCARLPMVALLILLAVSVTRAQQRYAVTIDRTWARGESYVIDAWITTREYALVTAAGEEGKETGDTDRIHFVAEAKVIESDPASHSITVHYTVRHCTHDHTGEASEALPAGSAATFTMVEGMGMMAPDEKSPEETSVDDDIYLRNAIFTKVGKGLVESMLGARGIGTSPPKRVGESWQLNRKEVARAINHWSDLVLSEKNVRSTATLLHVSPSDTIPSMRVRMATELSDFTFPKIGKMEKATGTIELVGDFPLDRSKGPLSTTMSARTRMRIRFKLGPSAPLATADLAYEREIAATFTYQ